MGNKMRALVNLLLLSALLFGVAEQVKAQESIVVTDVRVGHDFGEEIRFSARVEADNPIKEVLLIFRDVNEENTRVILLDADDEGRVSYTYDASEHLLRPFAKISLWFKVTLDNGESETSKKYAMIYDDNRFDWEMREEGMLRVYWDSGDEAFGLAALDVARSGLKEIQTLFPVPLDEPIDIYIYASSVDLQNALFMGGETWVGGHASPALGIVFVAIAPGTQEQIFMQQKIPHELAHILLYRYIGENYNRLPTWLLEGTASIAEQYANPEYELALKRAEESNSLIPIAELCAPFPRDASQAFLAYAESESFTRYLQNNYGTSGLDDLITAYADGLSCEKGVMNALDNSLTYLDANWQESVLGANPLGVAWRSLSPYVLLFAIVLAMPLLTGISALIKRRE
ncbi:MAG: hypothetical protein GY755_01200 [Chloroflexi bacterium]|nr:hypothetical protein [Chloroflexota bacterium]